MLNLFNGVEDSFNTAVKPFIENLTQQRFRALRRHEPRLDHPQRRHPSRELQRIPALLLPQTKKKKTKDRARRSSTTSRIAIGLEPPQDSAASRRHPRRPRRRLDDHLSRQLDVLKTMFDQKKDDDYFANFDYVTQRALFTMKNRRPSEFGDMRIYTPQEMLDDALREVERADDRSIGANWNENGRWLQCCRATETRTDRSSRSGGLSEELSTTLLVAPTVLSDLEMVTRIRQEGFRNSKVMEHRLAVSPTGSAGASPARRT